MPQLDPWIDRLIASLRQHAVPVLFGDRPHQRQSANVNVASGVVVDLGRGPFLLTASHVIQRALERDAEPRFHLLVGQSEIPLRSRLIANRDRLDVATLKLTDGEAVQVERDGYRVVHPTAWPPPDVTPNASIIAAGFPAHGRQILAWDMLDLAVETVRAFVRSAEDDQFTTHLDPEYTLKRIVDVSAPDRPPELEGFSGGPAFIIPENVPLVLPHLCGIVKEGGVSDLAPGRIVLHYARVHRLERNGAMG